MLSRTQVQRDVLALLEDLFSIGRVLEGASNSELQYIEGDEGKSSILIRPSNVIFPKDIEDKKPILAVSYDRPQTIPIGFNGGMVNLDWKKAKSTHVSIQRIPIYINSICASDAQSEELANFVFSMLQELREVLIDAPGYQEALFQSIGEPNIIRYVGPNNASYATPIAGNVWINRAYTTREKAKTLTQISAYMNGDNVWNGGPTDE